MASKNGMRPVHPGEILKEEYLKPMGLSLDRDARPPSALVPRTH